MKIAILMAAAGNRLGGLEIAAREFATALHARGHDVTLVTGTGPGARLQPDVRGASYRVVTVPMLGQSSLPARIAARVRGVHLSIVEAATFWAMARRSRAVMHALMGSDVVSAHFEVEAVAASRELHVPLVYYYAGPIDPRRLAGARPTKMVAISQMVADYHASLAGRFALPAVDGVVLPGVREDSIADGPAPGVGAQPPEAIFTGRLDLTGEKRVGKLLEWWPRVVQSVPGARLTLVGGGSAVGELRREIERAGLGGSVSMLGSLSHDALMQRLRAASLYVFPSRFETFGLAPLEALAAGLPVIASDLPALHESLGDAALLVPVEDDELWVSSLIDLLSDPSKRLERAARGPERARQLTWPRQAEAYEAYLAAAAMSRSTTAPR